MNENINEDEITLIRIILLGTKFFMIGFIPWLVVIVAAHYLI
jgi:hypothetical protein